ncbi:MAG: hypothetical protein DSM106950_17860 [Stigonema ocellatum SAG 48.90 = DSM 106950]|nr:hypothetical protein [Stigonema ocellatum SAG 48.90 = DSM 106950]
MKCPIEKKTIIGLGLASVVVGSINLLLQLKQEHVAGQKENIFALLGTSLNIFLFFLIFFTIEREIQQHKIAEAALLHANKELEIKLQQRTSQLTQAQGRLLSLQAEVDKALETQRELNLLKSQIINTISHEYRTPLTVILSSAELLQNYGHRWTEQKKLCHLNRIQTSTKHMTNLVDDMLFLGKGDCD